MLLICWPLSPRHTYQIIDLQRNESVLFSPAIYASPVSGRGCKLRYLLVIKTTLEHEDCIERPRVQNEPSPNKISIWRRLHTFRMGLKYICDKVGNGSPSVTELKRKKKRRIIPAFFSFIFSFYVGFIRDTFIIDVQTVFTFHGQLIAANFVV